MFSLFQRSCAPPCIYNIQNIGLETFVYTGIQLSLTMAVTFVFWRKSVRILIETADILLDVSRHYLQPLPPVEVK
jgi:hypothetical protein